jgi:hypothetical protein
MRIPARIPVTLLVAALLGGASVAAAGDHNPTLRPFWGTTRGEVGWSLSDACLPYQPVQTQMSGKGHLTHLGRSTIDTTHCANSGGAFNGRITLTAANGDQLLATYTAQTVSMSEGLLVQQMTGVFVDGGTGRFTHATGTFTAMVFVRRGAQPPTLETRWPVDLAFVGTIAY